MRLVYGSALAIAAIALIPQVSTAQNEASRSVAGGGISIPGWTGKGDKVNCIINGTVVGTYDKAAVVGTGKLKSTDGIYGIRFAHNTEAIVTGFGMTKN